MRGRRQRFVRDGVWLLCMGWLVFAGLSCDENPPTGLDSLEDADGIRLGRRHWVEASPPLVPIVPPTQTTRLDPADRAAICWYNLEPELATTRRDLNPTLDKEDDAVITALDIDLESMPASADAWVGVMQGFPGNPGLDVSDRRYLVIWINDFKTDPADRGGFVHIDIGHMDENFFKPDSALFHNEDRDRDGFAPGFDDTGLDGLFNDGRDGLTAPEPGYNEYTNPDPNRDDIDVSRINGRFSKVNGTESNGLYDTEDLDRNGQFDLNNAFFTLTIDLANDEPAIDVRQLHPDYDGFNDSFHQFDSWRMYRIPLADAVVVSDSDLPSWSRVRHIRVWFEDVASVVPSDTVVVSTTGHRIQIAELKFID